MKKRETRRPRGGGRFSLLFVLTILLLSSCTPQEKQPEGWLLYYTTDNSSTYGSAIAAQTWEGSETPSGEELMQALLDGPAEEGLVSPFPKGLSIQSMELEGEMMCLTLSEQYSGLTDISRTLADACIVMTICQLPGVESVEISSVGFWASAPAKRILSPEQLRLEMLLP